MTTNYTLSRPLTCSKPGVRFAAYNSGVMTTNDALTAPAAEAVAR
ncbi:hypothetical protein ACFXPW_25515 [Streptomyces goshikiensis]